jgi:hypothetical protein
MSQCTLTQHNNNKNKTTTKLSGKQGFLCDSKLLYIQIEIVKVR